jgi:glycosyltransferase involved in cell wall biosynthesis
MRTKNRTMFLARALDDILAQDFTDWSLVVVNDGGDPEPVDALLERPELTGRARALHRAQNGGPATAANQGVAAGSAPFIAVHDDDDTWHPQFLTRTVEHLSTTEDVAVAVSTEIIWERRVGSRLVETGREMFHPLMLEPTYFDLLRFNHMVPIGMLYRRSAMGAAGGYDESLGMVEDWVLHLNLSLAGRIGYLRGEALAFWHQRPESTGDAGNSVIAQQDAHHLYDRRYRNEALKAHVRENGAGALLYLAKYMDERSAELHARLDGIEQTQLRILEALDQILAQPPKSRWPKVLPDRWP